MSGLLRDIGTIEWCRRTKGVLSASERRRYLTAVMLETLRTTPRLLLYKAGLRGSGPDPSTFSPPDTVLVRHVLAACAHLDPMLIQHSYRSYLFARALGVVEGLACADEALFVATMFHDYAFPAADTTDDHCFTLSGAEAAAELLHGSALSPALLHDILDAITLHLNPRVGRDRGVLQHLMHDGVFVDTVGARVWELDGLGVQRVVQRHPRHSFLLRADSGLRAHGRRVSGSRARQLYRCGLGAALSLGPWRAHEVRSLQLEPTAALPMHTETKPRG